MILRRLTKHVKDQNWFAVALDFLIVVLGVFIGLQISNWNDARAFDQQERNYLVQLKDEVELNRRITEYQITYVDTVVETGKRASPISKATGNARRTAPTFWSISSMPLRSGARRAQ